jgi:hypothetical protein
MKIDRTKEEKRWATKTIGKDVEIESYAQNSDNSPGSSRGKSGPCEQATTASANLLSNAHTIAKKQVKT